ncbi:transglycosylase family protein [Dermatobacter hominis]|uniref:transglycosylase family protein n=1 Tax=Dermatobacter hominis TaxID=2884263 RepID=UPI001D125D74|nr:transglycosylase family protein [Dermatobacter hominis]UDY34299.1 transglycosylase family protein [Dermatobacter hominis]
MNRKSLTRALAALLVVGGFMLAACTPEQHAAVMAHVRAQDALRAGDRFAGAISDAGLARLRACESGGNYGIVSSNGLYRGAYQFHRTTWNSVAAKYYPHLRGVDPAAAAPYDQDRMARALWATGGPRNWPVCSRRV